MNRYLILATILAGSIATGQITRSVDELPTITGTTIDAAADFTMVRDGSIAAPLPSLRRLSLAEYVDIPNFFGPVSKTELLYLNGVTSALQDQLDGKVTLATSQTITGEKIFDATPLSFLSAGLTFNAGNAEISNGFNTNFDASSANFLGSSSANFDGSSANFNNGSSAAFYAGSNAAFYAGTAYFEAADTYFYASAATFVAGSTVDFDSSCTANFIGGTAVFDGGGINFNAGSTAIFGAGSTATFDAGSIATFDAGSNLTLSGLVIETSTVLSGAGAVPIASPVCKLTSTGASQSITLADGEDGQRLTLVHTVDGGSMVLTAPTKSGWSTSITFTNVADNVVLQFFYTIGWVVLSSRGATVL